VAFTPTQRTPLAAMPAFPGAQYNWVTRGLFRKASAKACSLPPLPTINTFIFLSLD